MRTRAELVTALPERAERAESEQELLARDAVLTERTRIAREMHDVVGHRVSLMVLQAGAIEMAAADRDRVEQLARQVQTAGRQALEELRQMVGVLRAEDGTTTRRSVRSRASPTSTGWSRSRRAGGDDRGAAPAAAIEPVDPSVGRAAYRIVQEALTNAGQARAGRRGLRERRSAHRRARGPGDQRRRPRRGAEPPGGGYGLVGLARAGAHAGRPARRADPRLDGGFVVEAVLPA